MASSTIGELLVRLAADVNPFSTSLKSATGQVGTFKSSAASIGGTLKTLAFTTAGAAIGAGFGIAITQGNELNSVTQRLAADTGLAGDAFGQQSDAIDNLYSHSLESMQTVEASLATEISGFDLTGQAADAATAEVIKYEEATGQGATAVGALKDIIDAYNLSASDQGTVMDLLVASHQQYATNVSADEAALASLAPSLDAMNMSIDDGVDLLNLFSKAGIDASKAPMALQHAIATLKPGQNLNDLIAQISSIQDPLQRAQTAAQIFGVRGGAQLAQALKPGITSLGDFATSADSTAGATDRAAQAVEDSWGNRATEAFHLVDGALGKFGSDLGPVLMVAELLPSRLTTPITTALGALGPRFVKAFISSTPAVTTAAGAQGTAAGAAEATQEAATVAAAGPEVAAAIEAQAPEVDAAAASVGTEAGSAMAGAAGGAGIIGGLGGTLVAGLGKLGVVGIASAAAIWGYDNIGSPIVGGVHDALFGQGSDDILSQFADWLNTPIGETPGETGRLGSSLTDMVGAAEDQAMTGQQARAQAAMAAAGLTASLAGSIEDSGPSFTKALTTALAGLPGAAANVATSVSDAYATATANARDTIDTALDTLTADEKKSMTPAQEQAKLKGELTSKALKEGLQSQDPVVKAQAEHTRDLIQQRLDDLQAGGKTASNNLVTQIVTVLSDPDARAEVTDAVQTLIGGGESALYDFLGMVVAGNNAGGSGSRGPTGLGRGYTARALGGPVTAGESYVVGEHGPELYTPRTSGNITPAGSFGGSQTSVYIGQITLQGIGSDVSPTSARRFGQQVADAITAHLQETNARFSERVGAHP